MNYQQYERSFRRLKFLHLCPVKKLKKWLKIRLLEIRTLGTVATGNLAESMHAARSFQAPKIMISRQMEILEKQ